MTGKPYCEQKVWRKGAMCLPCDSITLLQTKSKLLVLTNIYRQQFRDSL